MEEVVPPRLRAEGLPTQASLSLWPCARQALQGSINTPRGLAPEPPPRLSLSCHLSSLLARHPNPLPDPRTCPRALVELHAGPWSPGAGWPSAGTHSPRDPGQPPRPPPGPQLPSLRSGVTSRGVQGSLKGAHGAPLQASSRKPSGSLLASDGTEQPCQGLRGSLSLGE